MRPFPAHRPSLLVGRERELQVIDASLSELADGGAGSVLLLTGEPGIGKTRLLDELHVRAAEMGATVLRGRSAAAQGDLPYDVVAEAFGGWLGERGTDSPPPSGLSDRDLATAISAITGAVPPDRSGGDERFVIWRGMRKLLDALAGSAPVVLMLDDVHWADPASLDLIAYLLRRPPDGRVLLTLAWRDAHDRALTLELVEAARGSLMRRLEPSHLSADETARLVDTRLDASALRSVVAESGGNPFYAEQLGRHLSRAGADRRSTTMAAAVATATEEGGVPQLVVAAVHAEVEALPEPARRLARGAAIAGDPFVLDSAIAAAGLDADEVEPALDALASAAVVAVVDGSPRRFAFRHPIVRRAIHDATPTGWRIEAHARAARVLETAGAPTHLRAHHLARSAAPGDLRAARTLRAAATAVLPQSPASAAEWAAAARGLLDDDAAQRDERVELLELEARALTASGRLEAAHAALALALEATTAAHARRSALLQQIVYLELLLGWFDQARARLAGAFDAGAASDVLRLYLAGLQLVLIDPDAALAVAAAPLAADGADGADRQVVRSALLAAAAIARQALGDVPAAQADCDRASALLDTADPDVSDVWSEAALLVVLAERTLEREEQAIAHLRTILGARRPMRQIHVELRATTELALTLAERGELPEAAELAESAVETGRLVRSDWLLANALAAQVAVARMRGDIPLALALAREAFEQRLNRGRAYPGQQRRTLGATYLAAGDPDACVELFRTLGAVGAADMAPGGRVLVYELLTEAELLRGDTAAARAAATAAREHAERSELPRNRARALRAGARVRLASGDADGAAALALEAARLAAAAGAELDAARARLLAGQALAASGRRAEAIAELTAAERVFARGGIDLLRPLAVRELRGLGRRVAAGGDGVLSPREREIAALLAAGDSNQRIAEALVVSPRTVETHVRNILRKLNVANRTEVAAAL